MEASSQISLVVRRNRPGTSAKVSMKQISKSSASTRIQEYKEYSNICLKIERQFFWASRLYEVKKFPFSINMCHFAGILWVARWALWRNGQHAGGATIYSAADSPRAFKCRIDFDYARWPGWRSLEVWAFKVSWSVMTWVQWL